jgi:hypothetical protein
MSEEVRYALSAPAVGEGEGALPRAGRRGRGRGRDRAGDRARPTSLEAAALYGETSSESAEKLGDMSALRTDVGGLEISLASTALVGPQRGRGAAHRVSRTGASSRSRAASSRSFRSAISPGISASSCPRTPTASWRAR